MQNVSGDDRRFQRVASAERSNHRHHGSGGDCCHHAGTKAGRTQTNQKETERGTNESIVLIMEELKTFYSVFGVNKDGVHRGLVRSATPEVVRVRVFSLKADVEFPRKSVFRDRVEADLYYNENYGKY